MTAVGEAATYSPAVRDARLAAVWVTTGRCLRGAFTATGRCLAATARFDAAFSRYATGINSRSPAAGGACFNPLAAAMLPPAMP